MVRQIEQSYADSDLSPTRIADSLGMSSAYLGRIFRESTQTSISQYLNQTRIRRAEELLRETEQPGGDRCGTGRVFQSQVFLCGIQKYHGADAAAIQKGGPFRLRKKLIRGAASSRC